MARVSAPKTHEGSTAERILDAAEVLFARMGLDGAPVRLIAKQAHANIAAINYHFGTKEALYKAVFTRRIRPLNEARIKALDTAIAAEGGPTLETVLHSFIHPTLAMGKQHPAFLGIMSRNIFAPPPFMADHMSEVFKGIVLRFRPVLQQILPDVSPDELFWRMIFMTGSLVFTTAHIPTLERISGGLCHDESIDDTCSRLVAFSAAGLRQSTSRQITPRRRANP